MDTLDMIRKKIFLNIDDFKAKLAYYKFKNFRIVFTNGCFDIIHRGHVEYLSKASDKGDVLIIGLNTDQSVKKLKGNNRPVQDQTARSINLSAMTFVNDIILFNEETPDNLIRKILPDVLVKGKDYKIDEIGGADVVMNHGGEGITIELTDGYSTTSILEKKSK